MKNIYYDYSKILSYNALLNFIIGERGVGKTYGATKFVVNRYINHNEEFVYLRRYKTELKTSVPKFFDAINGNNEFPNNKLTSNNNTFYCDGKPCGYALSLSTANILKSTTFDKVKTIIFDEFIIDKGTYHYLQNEVIQLLDIIETIGRLRNIRVLFLGNAISITNPYFAYFNLTLPYNSDVKTFKDGLILVNYIKNEKYRQIKKQTKFGKLIEGTSYSKYAIDNEFLRDSKAFIKKKTPQSKFFFILYLDGNTYGVWRDLKEDVFYISNQIDSLCPIRFTFNQDDHNFSTILASRKNNPWLKSIIEHYRLARLCFENQQIKNIIMDYISKLLTY